MQIPTQHIHSTCFGNPKVGIQILRPNSIQMRGDGAQKFNTQTLRCKDLVLQYTHLASEFGFSVGLKRSVRHLLFSVLRFWEKVFFCLDGVGKYPKVFYGFTVLRFCKISEWTSPNVNYYYLLLQSIRCRTPGYGCTVPLYV